MSTFNSVSALTPDVDQKELAKRRWIYARKPSVVCVRVLASGILQGLQNRERSEEDTRQRHREEALARKLHPNAIRGADAAPDTGLPIFQKEEKVRLSNYIVSLCADGFKLVDQYWVDTPKGKVNYFWLQQEADASDVIEKSPAFDLLSRRRFNHCSVWANPKYVLAENPKGGQYRLDTINVAAMQDTTKDGRMLRVKGNTYELVQA